MVSIASRLARCGCPLGKICVACISLLSSFCTSWRECALFSDQACRAATYLCHFASASDTVCCSMSHVKPMKVGVDENGISFDGSQGMPSTFEMLSMSVRLYV